MPVQHTQRQSSRSPRFPNRIREYRLKQGLSQRNLAELLGRGRHAVSAWERGLSLPAVPHLFKMAKALGTLAESLYMEFYASRPKENDQADRAST